MLSRFRTSISSLRFEECTTASSINSCRTFLTYESMKEGPSFQTQHISGNYYDIFIFSTPVIQNEYN